jgi:hypothetical protein
MQKLMSRLDRSLLAALRHHGGKAPRTPTGPESRLHRIVVDRSGEPGLWSAVDCIAGQDLPSLPWDVSTVEGYSETEFALVLRVHHALADGAAVAALSALLAEAGEQQAVLRLPAPSRAGLPHRVRAAVPAVGPALAFLLDRRRPWRPPLADSQGHRQVIRMWAGTTTERLAEAGCRTGASYNDVFLAALSGALRAWLPELGAEPSGRGPVRALVPVSLRHGPRRGALGNHYTATHIDLPCHIADPMGRLATVTDAGGRTRRSLHRSAWSSLCDLVPAGAGTALVSRSLSPRRVSLVATYAPGPSGPLNFAGRPVFAAYPLGPLPPNHPVAAAMTTQAGRVGVSFAVDALLPVADMGALPGLWLRAVDELCAVGRTKAQAL